jgi:hypothetical protein
MILLYLHVFRDFQWSYDGIVQQDCDKSLQISISSLKAIQTPYSIILIEEEYNPTFLRTSTNEKGDF